MHQFSLTGAISDLTVNDRDNPTARITIQYGPAREPTPGASMEFINAVQVRIPTQLLLKIKDLPLANGTRVEVTGHLQGVTRSHRGNPAQAVELVAASLVAVN